MGGAVPDARSLVQLKLSFDFDAHEAAGRAAACDGVGDLHMLNTVECDVFGDDRRAGEGCAKGASCDLCPWLVERVGCLDCDADIVACRKAAEAQ